MTILSHRGYWIEPSEKNHYSAFERSFSLGYGTETDVRDCNGKLVISHDPPNGCEISIGDFLQIVGGRKLPLALNIKSDGLASLLKHTMQSHKIGNWFVFDMSVPDMMGYIKEKIPVFSRMSELEKNPVLFNESEGIWLDSFFGNWYDNQLIIDLVAARKQVCVVSSELHGRDPLPLWKMLYSMSDHQSLMLCTDLPEQAKKYFEERQ